MVKSLKWIAGICFTTSLGILVPNLKEEVRVFNNNNSPYIIAFILIFVSGTLIIFSLILDNDSKKRELANLEKTLSEKTDSIKNLNSEINQLRTNQSLITMMSSIVNSSDVTPTTTTTTTTIKPI